LVKRHKPIVAMFGGSFDPPHKAHQDIIQKALKNLDIEYLVMMPTYLNPFKASWHTPPYIRYDWCKTLFKDNAKVIVSDYEIKEQKSVTTYQTITHLKQKYDIRYLIIGSDNLASLHKWHNFEWLNKHITWVIFTREGYTPDTTKLISYKLIELNVKISSTHIRESLDLSLVDDKIKPSVQQQLKRKQMTLEQRVKNIIKVLDDKKAEEIEVFNLDGADYIASRVVIANSLNSKHTLALYDNLKDELKPKGESFLHSDISDEWVVADLGDILIHIMVPEYRQRYSLEEFLSELIS